MRHHRLVGSAAARAAGFKQRGLEPAAMLVGAFEIKLRRPGEVLALLQHEGVGAAGVEPDIENVVDLLPIVRIGDEAFEETLLGALLEPGIGALLLRTPRRCARATRRTLPQIRMRPGDDRPLVLAVPDDVAEHGDGNAPGALARHDPVGTRLDHPCDAVLALRRHPARVADGRKRAGAERVRLLFQAPVHGDEPLRGGAEDHRLLRAPGMRDSRACGASGRSERWPR